MDLGREKGGCNMIDENGMPSLNRSLLYIYDAALLWSCCEDLQRFPSFNAAHDPFLCLEHHSHPDLSSISH